MDMDKIFAPITWQDPHEKAPDFIKGNLCINAEKFSEFLKGNMQHASEKGWLKIVMKVSKNDVIYFELDTWKPEKKEKTDTPKSPMTSIQPDGSDPIDTDQIPF